MSNTASEVGAPAAGGAEKSHEPHAAKSAAGWRAVWAHWMKMGHAIGVVQTRILMVLFYFVFVLPLGVALRLRGDPLHLKPRKQGNWTPHDHQDQSLDNARRQF